MSAKIGIISDTHGFLHPKVLEILRECDYIFHAGDVDRPGILDLLRPLASIYVVRGNNDREWAENLSKSLRFKAEGIEFFMVHNKKDVLWDLGSVQVVIFGHTHKYFQEEIDGRLWLNTTGNAGLARGGSGDVLSGMIAALLTQGLDASLAACCGVWLHGAAADRCAARLGQTGMLPHDILADLCALFGANDR